MITFYNYRGDVISQDNVDTLEANFYTNRTVILYIRYTKGSETSLDLQFQVYESMIDDWFPLQFDDGDKGVVTYSKSLTEGGKYRIVVPTADNEELIKVIASTTGAIDNTVEIWVIPMSVGM